MKKSSLISLVASSVLFVALAATGANAEGMKCGAGKCGDSMKKVENKSEKKCGAQKKDVSKCGKEKKAEKKCGAEKKAEKKCGAKE